jgi:hypothetical protein
LASHQLAGQPRALADLVAAVEGRDAKSYAEIISRFGLGPYCYQICGWICSRICSEFCYCVCPSNALNPLFTKVGLFDIYADIDSTSGRTNKSIASAGGADFAFYSCLELNGFCPATSPADPSVAMKYRFLYDNGSGPQALTNAAVCNDTELGSRTIPWPENVAGVAGSTSVSTVQTVMIHAYPPPADPVPPAAGAPWVGPAAHYVSPDPVDGWVTVDPNAVGGGFQTLMGFNTAAVVAGGDPIAGPPAVPVVPAGSAVPSTSQRSGTDLAIIFQATRVTTFPPGTTPDFTNTLTKIRINNWNEVNELNFVQFATGCCTPINDALGVQFTVDHEEMDAGTWTLQITSCSPSAPGDVTAAAIAAPGASITPRGGAGTLNENTTHWDNCSYTATLSTTPALTTGLIPRSVNQNPLTFAICAHKK